MARYQRKTQSKKQPQAVKIEKPKNTISLNSDENVPFYINLEVVLETVPYGAMPIGHHQDCNGSVQIYFLTHIGQIRIVCKNCYLSRTGEYASQSSLGRLLVEFEEEDKFRSKHSSLLNHVVFGS